MNVASAKDELALLVRPAGGLIYPAPLSATDAQLEIQQAIYGAASEDDVLPKHRAAIDRIASARVVVMGIPSDIGAGFMRGANLGAQSIRSTLVADGDWISSFAERGIVDAGDVLAVPQLQHDSMVSEEQIAAARESMYPNVDPGLRSRLPVSPLSVAERAIDLVFSINPRARVFVLGGDHSTAWPVAASLARGVRGRLGIVQVDAHPDLAERRAGVKYCYSTWACHANRLLDEDGRLIQVGIRQTRRDAAYWKAHCNVVQHWADDCNARPEEVVDAIVSQLRERGVTDVYFSNDIDGTDPEFAGATGTPVPDGIHPELVVQLVRRLGAEFRLAAADVMEVAPMLESASDGTARTVAIAAWYARESIEAMLGE